MFNLIQAAIKNTYKTIKVHKAQNIKKNNMLSMSIFK